MNPVFLFDYIVKSPFDLACFVTDESDGLGIGSELRVFNESGYSQFENLTHCFIKVVFH